MTLEDFVSKYLYDDVVNISPEYSNLDRATSFRFFLELISDKSRSIRPILKTCSPIINMTTAAIINRHHGRGIRNRGISCPRRIGIEILDACPADIRMPIMRNGRARTAFNAKKQWEKRWIRIRDMRSEWNEASLIDHSFRYKPTNMLTITSG